MDFKLVDTVRLQKFKDKLLSIIDTNVTAINNSISSETTAAISSAIATEVSNRNTAISSAIATEVSNRNTELAKKSDTGHTHSNATTSASGFMSATDKTKLDGIATGAGVQVNSDWNATSGFAQILNKPTLATVATSGSYTDLSNKPTIPTYTAGPGIKIENGVISVVIERTKVDKPTCPGYTLYGDYFLSDTITPNKNWEEAKTMIADVIVTQNYNYGGAETKNTTAKTLSKEELETIPQEERKISENGHFWYWTSTPYYGNSAWIVVNSGYFSNDIVTYINGSGGARLGFKNPFI